MSYNLIIVLIVLIILSGFFSATETAFTSLNRIRMKYLANNGDKRAEKILELLDNYTSLLSTILIGNNVVNIFSASLATVLFVAVFGENGVTYSSLTMTLIVLVFGEIGPKTLAKQQPEKFAMFALPFISVLVFILKPVAVIFNGLETLLSKTFKSEDAENLRAEEFVTMVEEANEDGDMDDEEADLITNAIEFDDVDVSEIFTPRVDVIAIDIDEDSMDDIEKAFRESGYSRLPVYKESIDNVVGVIHEKDFYYIYYKEKLKKVDSILQEVVYTSEHVKIDALLRQLQSSKLHMAVVLDEYGGTAGIITMEDILEELVGEIYDEHDEIVEYFNKLNENEYIVNCEVDVDEFFEYFDMKPEEEYDFNTLSAWVIHMMDKIGDVGETFDYENLHITITKTDKKVIEEIKVEIIKEDE